MFNKTLAIPVIATAEKIYKTLSPLERWIFYSLIILLALGTLMLMKHVYIGSTVLVPSSGGKIVEGLVGAPRFVNPVLAISQTDKDLTELIYAGLMTTDQRGGLITELAESYSVSEDAMIYEFTLYNNLTFHDGTPLTVADVIFTIEKIVQPDIKSPQRANWEGVTVEQIGENTIRFSLSKPYAQFLQNTTLGILPQEHWDELTADEFIFSKLNTEPIGSGPYRFISAEHSNSGIPSSFTLSRFSDYVRGKPYIKSLTINFYNGRDLVESALAEGVITSVGEVSPQNVSALLLKDNKRVAIVATLPRIFAVFFNISHNEVLTQTYMREILRDVINTEDLIKENLDGYAISIDTPILLQDSDIKDKNVLSIEEAKIRLEKNGWSIDEESGYYKKGELELALTLSTANSAELKGMATSIAKTWEELGIRVKLEVFEPGNLTQSVLRTREYDALLFGEIIGVDPDPYAFWHSSQRNDPGLNLANYASGSVDKLLMQARKTIDNTERNNLYTKLSKEINADAPAIFLYAPQFIYLTDKSVRGIRFASIMEPSDRFSNIHLWHINTSRVWHFLAN